RLATPLEVRLAQLGRWLVAACLLLVVVVFASGVWRGIPVLEMFMIAVSLAVAAIPEGLPAVVTIALALGVQRMSRRAAIIRRLPAVETLGCTNIICSDKTGTLTENRMQVQRLWIGGAVHKGQGLLDLGIPQEGTDLFWALRVCGLCNSANIEHRASFTGGLVVQGDPTEAALVQLSHLLTKEVDKHHREYLLLGELPFSSERKRMTVLYSLKGEGVGLTKGAWEVILARSRYIHWGRERIPLTALSRQRISEIAEEMARDALRVMALAYKKADGLKDIEEGLTFVGLVGLYDPPRREVKAAIRKAEQAGIRTIMVTGDHKTTATAIGVELGLVQKTASVLTGHELDRLTDRELIMHLQHVSVFSRVSPEHKLRIVRCLKSMGHIVAMTGDGVNDAPAVAEADVGIAMGQGGTDVTKEASDMVLADDNYATIIHAIEEGRGVYTNIRKFVGYLLTCNVGEVLTMLVATLLKLPLPLVAVQILWMNLVTDGLPAVALGMDPPGEDVMRKKPRRINEHILSGGMARRIFGRGSLLGLSTVGVFAIGLWLYPGNMARARSLAFCTIVLAQLLHAFECSTYGAGPRGIVANPLLVSAVSVSILMQFAVVYVPLLRNLFRTVVLSPMDWGLILLFAGWPLVLNWTLRLLRNLASPRVSWLRT
ncbi:MAG: cation-translocating P-type ATPase, partial [Limnochordia bacterium]|nr:cation-translocating P-type ATPase [Limnochordia bacterium]